MSTILSNYRGFAIPSLTDPQLDAAGQISGLQGGNDWAEVFSDHDHSDGRGLPVSTDNVTVTDKLDMLGNEIINADAYGTAGNFDPDGWLNRSIGFANDQFIIKDALGDQTSLGTFPIDIAEYTGDVLSFPGPGHAFVADEFTIFTPSGELQTGPNPTLTNGIWTPTAFANGVEVSYDFQIGNYQLVGKTCFIFFSVGWTDNVPIGQIPLEIRNLPFNQSGLTNGGTPLVSLGNNIDTTSNPEDRNTGIILPGNPPVITMFEVPINPLTNTRTAFAFVRIEGSGFYRIP